MWDDLKFIHESRINIYKINLSFICRNVQIKKKYGEHDVWINLKTNMLMSFSYFLFYYYLFYIYSVLFI